jgi:sugar lactone lactonase YvrE
MTSQIIDADVLYAPHDEALRFLPEGPYPYAPGVISWLAIQHGPSANVGSVNLLDVNERSNQSISVPGRPGFAFATTTPGKLVVGCERQLGYLHTNDGRWEVICDGIDAAVQGTIINDAVVWEDNLIFGCKDLAFATPKAGLYLYRGRDRKLIQWRCDQVCSNGKAVRKTDRGLELIDIDSPTRKIVAYRLDIDRGTLGDPRVLLDLTDDPGVPDGMTLTPDGRGLIVSIYLPQPAPFGQTRWYDIDTGHLVAIWRTIDSPQNTCPQLVSVGGKVWLIITTAVEHMPPQQRVGAPQAGAIFWAQTDFDSASHTPPFPG